MNIYVGNLAYAVTESDLRSAFGAHGEVVSAAVITDRDTGRSKGFGFVEMADQGEGRNAIAALDGADIKGRQIKVNEARPKESRPSGGGGGGYRGGNGGGGRRDRW